MSLNKVVPPNSTVNPSTEIIFILLISKRVRQPSRGKVSAPKDCVIAYLPQHQMTEDGRTVFEEASISASIA